jgi:hypothetical protein
MASGLPLAAIRVARRRLSACNSIKRGGESAEQHKIEFSFLNRNLMVPAGYPRIFNMQARTKIMYAD